MTTLNFQMSDEIYDPTVLFVDRISTYMMGLDEDDFEVMNPFSGFHIKEEEDT